MNNYDGYEPIATEIFRLSLDYWGDTLVQNLIKDIRKTDSIVELKRGEEEKAYRSVSLLNYSFGDSDKKRYEAEIEWSQKSSARHHVEQELLILVDSILPLVEKQDTSIYGWKINHRFKYKGGGDIYPRICDYTYYMDKDCNQILLKVDDQSWSYDDVEFTDRIYKEALERRKKK